jgi:hypothetical protein
MVPGLSLVAMWCGADEPGLIRIPGAASEDSEQSAVLQSVVLQSVVLQSVVLQSVVLQSVEPVPTNHSTKIPVRFPCRGALRKSSSTRLPVASEYVASDEDELPRDSREASPAAPDAEPSR